MKKLILSLGIVLSLTVSSIATAAIINGDTVSFGGQSYNTFFDEDTSLTWLDLDSWSSDVSASFNSVSTALVGSGFHIALEDEVTTLLANMPLDGTAENFDYYAETIGAFTDKGRDLIWAIYDKDGSTTSDTFFANSGQDFWSTWASGDRDDSAFSFNSGYADLGFFVVSDGVTSNPTTNVPEPSTIAIFSLGLLGLAARRKK